jgi:chromosome partitioning protein
METIAVLSLKGGVGKTTLTINFAATLCGMGKRVLIVDSDPQCNLTHFFGLDPITLKGYEFLLTADFLFDKLFYQYNKFLHILPAGRKLKELELSITQKYNEKKWLWHALTEVAFKDIEINYDYILIDCPAYAGLLSINALNYVKNVFIPVQCQYLSLHGLKKSIIFIKKIKKFYNPPLRNPVVIPTMFDRRDNHSYFMLSELRRLYYDSVSETVIRYNVSLSQAAIYNKTIFEYKPKSRGAEDFKKLGKEIVEKLSKQEEIIARDKKYRATFSEQYEEIVNDIEKIDLET